jgi:hypothetical protein
MVHRLRQLSRLTRHERARLVEAVGVMIVVEVLLRFLHFPRLAPRLGAHMAESADPPDAAAREEATTIRWAVDAAARHLPWKPVCLPQAVTAQWMLRRRRIPCTLYLGVDPRQEGYDAHAWVRVGTVIVAGGPLQERFVVVSTFA